MLMENTFNTTPLRFNVMAQEAYETTYGLLDHSSENSPLAVYLDKPTERMNGVGTWEYYAEKFIDLNISERIGIGLEAFMKLPLDRVEFLIDRADRDIRKEMKVVNDAENKNGEK